MNYYKLINQQDIIGAITSNDFIVYSPSTDCYLSATERTGEYANFQNKLYRDTWMASYQLYAPHAMVNIIQTTQEEYDAIVEALKTEEIIHIIDNEDEPHIPDQIDPNDIATLEFIQSSKIKEMSYSCHITIEAGFDLIIRGETHHFSLTTQDQLNLMNLKVMAQTEELIPYHADGEECTFYTAQEINEIIATANNFKNYQLAYYNSLKAYISALETIEAITTIEYGTPIPDEYKSDVLRVLE